MGKGGIVRTRTIDRGRKRARKREELQHKQNVWPRANIYWLNRTHVRCALTKRYLRSYGNLTIDSSKSLNNTPFHCSRCTTSGSSNDTFDRREQFAIFGVKYFSNIYTQLSRNQRNSIWIWKMKNYSRFLSKEISKN